MKYTESELKTIHDHSFKNRKEITESTKVTCLFCGKTYGANKIKEWVDDEQTAVCPYCGVDSIVGDKSGYKFSRELLAELHKYWFE